jgi:hypothetical protein
MPLPCDRENASRLQPMKQPLPLMKVLKEKRLVKRALYDLTVNRLVSGKEAL